MIKIFTVSLWALLWALTCTTSHAVLDIKITEGRASAIPIAVGAFAEPPNMNLGVNNPGQIILSDLTRSGFFKAIDERPDNAASPSDINLEQWRQKSANYMIIGNITPSTEGLTVHYFLLDVFSNASVLLNAQASIKTNQLRKYAHTISDKIFATITGKQSAFTSSIAYILHNKQRAKPYSLIFADYDGFNEIEIIKAQKTLMSPDISPDKKEIAYVSFENDKSEVYIQHLYTGKRQRIAGEKGINTSPAWSPDGQKLALVMSQHDNVDIYVYDKKTQSHKRITRSQALDTEPRWYDKGNKLLFTSNRGGGPQLYSYDFTSRRISRLTFDGRYNTSGRFNASNDALVMVHRLQKRYQIALKDEKTGALSVLTNTDNNVTPSFSPNGNMILYATRTQSNQSVLAVMSTDGQHKIILPSPDGDVRDPVWSAK